MSKSLKIVVFISLIFVLMLICAETAIAEGNKITGVIWVDKNANGVFDDGETCYDDAKVCLQSRAGDEAYDVGDCFVSSAGEFSFANVPEGEYRLKIITGGYCFTVHGGDSDALPAVGTNGYTAWRTVSEDSTFRIGVLKTNNYIGIIAYNDEDENGGRRNSEGLIKGVQFTLVCDIDGVEYELGTVESTKSDKNFATFRQVSPGTYKLKMVMPEGYIQTKLGQKINLYYNVFPPADGDVVYSLEFNVVHNDSIGMCAGFVKAASLAGRVWDTENDCPLEGAVVTIYSKAFDATYTVSTDADGAYSFERINGSDYVMTVELPDGKTFAESGLEMKPAYAGAASCSVKVKAGKDKVMDDILVVDETEMIITADEALITEDDLFSAAGVSVSLYDDNGKLICTEAFKDGTAKLRGLKISHGAIAFTFDQDHVAVFSDGQTVCALSSDSRIDLNFEKGISYATVSFVKNCSISGYVYEDSNNDGKQDAGEQAVPGLEVIAVNEAGETCSSAVTVENGDYVLSGLVPGSYTVRFISADPYIAAVPGTDHAIVLQTPDYGETAVYELTAGERLEDINGAVFCAHTVSGHVGVKNERGEPVEGIASGITVVLYHANGERAGDSAYDITDENGSFTVKGVVPGAYYVEYILPENYLFTSPSIEELEYTSGVFGVDDNVVVPEIYVLPCGRIYGQVLHGDEPVNMSVELRGASIDILYAVQADENGYFDIPRILPDTYMIVFTLDDDYVFGAKTDALIGAYDENRREIECEIGVGQVMQDVKVDAALTGTVNGHIFFDYSGDGDAENVLNTLCDSGVTVDLIRNGVVVSTVTADSTGCFVFEKVIPAADYQVVPSLQDDMRITFPKTDTVSLSVADGEDDVQVNIGIVQFASISGSVWNIGNSMGAVSNIHVYLYNEYVNGPIAECLTDENGAFLFDTLEPGSCYLAADLPDGYLFARKSDTVSHASYIFDDDEPVMIELSMGTAATGCDIGIGAPGRIGDYAWLDINGNGLIDIGEPQLPGIRIEMYMGNELVAETYSDEYGYWDFTDMYPGEYTMKVYMPAEVMTTLHRDDFVNVNSILPSGLTGTAEVTVYVPSDERDLACDLGFVCIDENVLPEAVKDLPTIDWSFNGKKQYNFD